MDDLKMSLELNHLVARMETINETILEKLARAMRITASLACDYLLDGDLDTARKYAGLHKEAGKVHSHALDIERLKNTLAEYPHA